MILADVWKNTSLVAFFLLAGLTTIPRDLYEAARIDGYGRWGAFVHITLPLLRPVIVVVLVLRTIEAFKVFDIIYVMTGGGPANGTQSIAFYTYQRAFSDEFFGYGSALAYLIVLFIMVFAILYIRLLRSEQYAMAERHGRVQALPHRHPRRRRARLAGFLAPFAWLLIASLSSQAALLKVPLSWIPSHLSFSRYSQIFSSHGGTIFANFRASLINSLIIATATVAISITVGVFGAYAFARLRFRGQRASLLLFLSTYMVPPIALVIPLYLIMVTPAPAQHADRPDHRLLHVRHAVRAVDHGQLLPDHPARPRGRGADRRLHAHRGAVPGHPAARAAGAALDDAVRVPDRLGRVPLRADLHLDDRGQDDPRGHRRVHRALHDRLRSAGRRRAAGRHTARADRGDLPALHRRRPRLRRREGMT